MVIQFKKSIQFSICIHLQFLDHFCSFAGKEDVANLLIAHDADVSVQDYSGKTPLMCAISAGMVKTVENILKKGVDGKLI